MTEFPYFWEAMCLCYFVGGLTIGWAYTKWRGDKPKRTGMGRWDWSNKKYYGEGDQ